MSIELDPTELGFEREPSMFLVWPRARELADRLQYRPVQPGGNSNASYQEPQL